MDKTNNLQEFAWKIPEYHTHIKDKKWYIIASVIVMILLTLTVWTPNYFFHKPNFLFTLIILISFVLLIYREFHEEDKIIITIDCEGIQVGKNFYDFDELKNFSIIFKPNQDIRNLYFEFKSSIKQRLSIPLTNMDPLLIRDHLLKYVEEDYERLHPPVSEKLAQTFKL